MFLVSCFLFLFVAVRDGQLQDLHGSGTSLAVGRRRALDVYRTGGSIITTWKENLTSNQTKNKEKFFNTEIIMCVALGTFIFLLLRERERERELVLPDIFFFSFQWIVLTRCNL